MEIEGFTTVYTWLKIYDCFVTFWAISLLICMHTSHVGIFNLIIRKIAK